jgi:hypothetical protein
MKEAETMPAWECAETDRPRYLRWVWEVSHLPFVFVALGECRDAYKLKLARSWKIRMEEWADHQVWLERRGNPLAWKQRAPRFADVLRGLGGTEDDILDGQELMYEIGYYGINDDWRMKVS